MTTSFGGRSYIGAALKANANLTFPRLKQTCNQGMHWRRPFWWQPLLGNVFWLFGLSIGQPLKPSSLCAFESADSSEIAFLVEHCTNCITTKWPPNTLNASWTVATFAEQVNFNCADKSIKRKFNSAVVMYCLLVRIGGGIPKWAMHPFANANGFLHLQLPVLMAVYLLVSAFPKERAHF